MLIIISGTSGSGKNTVISELLKRNENIQFLKSCTTRKRRPNESEDSYIFLSKPNFDDKLKNGEIFEHEEIHQNFYGLSQASLNEVVDCHENNMHFIKDLGVLGQISVKQHLKNRVKVLSIFLTVPKTVLIERLRKRGEQDIDLRISRMEFEEGYMKNFDFIVQNISLDKTVKKIEKIIKKTY